MSAPVCTYAGSWRLAAETALYSRQMTTVTEYLLTIFSPVFATKLANLCHIGIRENLDVDGKNTLPSRLAMDYQQFALWL